MRENNKKAPNNTAYKNKAPNDIAYKNKAPNDTAYKNKNKNGLFRNYKLCSVMYMKKKMNL